MSESPDYLPGNPPMYGVKEEGFICYQGETICIPASLLLNGSPVNSDDYNLTVTVKKDLHEAKCIWQGFKDAGIFIDGQEVTIKIRPEIVLDLPSGLYYVSVTGQLKRDPGNTVVLFESSFNITPSASSPYPITKVFVRYIKKDTISSTINVPIEYF